MLDTDSDASSGTKRLELWGGTECTLNRVGDQVFEQLKRTGHAHRLTDLDLFADLGITAMRYPVLWELTAPDGPETADWSWPDERLTRLRELGIRPIVGLVHHGSGPPHTNLLDPWFPEGLAAFARSVAERYPWVDSYTPVNEPLTTARFSGLYGHWHPHGRDHRTCLRVLLTQCRAIVLSMQAIRQVNPAAQLMQTDDLGKVHSTPALAHEARFQNERRWLTFDLLCGRLDRHHPLWEFVMANGVEERELEWFLDHPCPPDIIGIDHYLSSERYLDEHLERYPSEWPPGHPRPAHADILTARIRAEGPVGPETLLREAWERYHLPIAATEVHNGCSREDQMRWFLEVWDAAQSLQADGVDIRAVTAWTLLGAYDWAHLVTRQDNCYEPGVFDLRSSVPRPTAMAGLLRDLSSGRRPDHPLLAVPGWWRRSSRLTYGISLSDSGLVQPADSLDDLEGDEAYGDVPPLVIAGANGTLGRVIARLCRLHGIPYRRLSHAQMDIADRQSVEAVLEALRPWAVVNAAGYVRVDDAERDEAACHRENAVGPGVLATACADHGIQLLTFSSDLVFDGARRSPYVESDEVHPLGVYGASKAEGEERVRRALPSALIVRSSAFFGPWDEHNFVTTTLRALAAGQSVVAADDQIVSPTYVPDLVTTSLDLLIDGERGVWHLANEGSITWADLARLAAARTGLDPSRVIGRPGEMLGLIAPRPAYSVLGSERGMLLPSLDDALSRYVVECEIAWRGHDGSAFRGSRQGETVGSTRSASQA